MAFPPPFPFPEAVPSQVSLYAPLWLAPLPDGSTYGVWLQPVFGLSAKTAPAPAMTRTRAKIATMPIHLMRLFIPPASFVSRSRPPERPRSGCITVMDAGHPKGGSRRVRSKRIPSNRILLARVRSVNGVN